MKSMYKKAIEGKLSSSPQGPKVSVEFNNKLGISLNVIKVHSDGRLAIMKPFKNQKNVTTYQGEIYLFKTLLTGSLVSVIKIGENKRTYNIDDSLLTPPNKIGFPPDVTEGSAETIIPCEPMSVLVGVSEDNGICILREQRWRIGPDSFSLAPRETREISTSVTTGVERTSSSVKSISKNAGLNVNGGWGAISASASASLSSRSVQQHEISLKEENTFSVTQTFVGKDDSSLLFFIWQMEEKLIWYKKSKVVAAVTNKILPVIPLAVSYNDSTAVKANMNILDSNITN